MKDYLTHVFQNKTSSGDMDEKVYHWLDSFENFHKKYIIMPSILLNCLFLEESLFVKAWWPPGFIHQENETWCYLNSTLQILYLIFLKKIGTQHQLLYHAEYSEKKSQHFVHNYQKIMIIKELQKLIGEIYLEWNKKKLNIQCVHGYVYSSGKHKLCTWINE